MKSFLLFQAVFAVVSYLSLCLDFGQPDLSRSLGWYSNQSKLLGHLPQNRCVSHLWFSTLSDSIAFKWFRCHRNLYAHWAFDPCTICNSALYFVRNFSSSSLWLGRFFQLPQFDWSCRLSFWSSGYAAYRRILVHSWTAWTSDRSLACRLFLWWSWHGLFQGFCSTRRVAIHSFWISRGLCL